MSESKNLSAEEEIAAIRKGWDDSVRDYATAYKVTVTGEPQFSVPPGGKLFIGTAFRNARIVCDIEDKDGKQTIEIPISFKQLGEIQLGETISQAILRSRKEFLSHASTKNPAN